MLGRQWVLSLQSIQMGVEVQAHPLPPPGQVQQLWENNRTWSTQMVVEVQAHPHSPDLAKLKHSCKQINC